MKCSKINLLAIFLLPIVHAYVEPVVLVHGGADLVLLERVQGRIDGAKNATRMGYKILMKGGSVVDAVEAAVAAMEDNMYFNAGRGSSLNLDGEIEMDACIMRGSNLSSGAVSGIKNVANPIKVARLVMDESPHFLLSGEGAKRFAKSKGIPLIPTSALVTDFAHQDYQIYMRSAKSAARYVELGVGSGGAGAIAIDSGGHLAVAASTGGRIAKLAGRGSDVSTVGAGLYADDYVGAVVVTGHGEAIARFVMAHEIISGMKRGFDAGVATRNVVKSITERFHKPTGAITISKNGQVAISFTTEKMAWAYQLDDSLHYGADDYDHFSERIKT